MQASLFNLHVFASLLTSWNFS